MFPLSSRRAFACCLWLILLLPAVAAPAASVAYQLRQEEARDVKLNVNARGTIDLETSGPAPVLAFQPQGKVDPASQYVFAFDYFCAEGIPDLAVATGELPADDRTARNLNLGKAEVWQPFRGNLARALGGRFVTEGGANLSLLLGSRPGVRLQLRNVRVDTALPEDLKSPEQLRVERTRRLARNRNVLDYLHAEFPFRDPAARFEGTQIHFSATLTGPKPAGDLFLAEFPIWSTPWLLLEEGSLATADSGLRIETAAAPDANGAVSARVPRVLGGRDRLASRWALVERTGEGYRLLSSAVYPDDRTIPSRFASEPMVVGSKKGMGGVYEHVDELVELGVGSVTVNVTPTQFFRLRPSPGRVPFTYQGKTYYFEEKALEKYDRTLKDCADHNIKAALILLIQWDGPEGLDRLLPHPGADRAGTYPMPNLTTEDAADAYGAILAFLGQRWGDRHGANGHAPYWILHNEVDYGWSWTNMGETAVGVFLDTYVRSMRLCYALARQANPDARVFISLTHNWNAPEDPRQRSYAPKEMLELLALFSQREGDFGWGVAYHPYPQSLFEAATWNDTQAKFSYNTRFITPRNIEVLDAFMHEPAMRYHGETVRPVILSEQGFNTRNYSEDQQRLQAAAFVYMFQKLRPLGSIEGFQNHRWVDHAGEGGLLVGIRTVPDEKNPRGEKKLAWEVYRQIDTPQEAEKTGFAKEIIGVKELSDVLYRGPIEGASAGAWRSENKNP